jgi:hypothetical protein
MTGGKNQFWNLPAEPFILEDIAYDGKSWEGRLQPHTL